MKNKDYSEAYRSLSYTVDSPKTKAKNTPKSTVRRGEGDLRTGKCK